MRVDNKNFYFDIGQNNRGIYMRISEVSIEKLIIGKYCNVYPAKQS
jgi:PurA ssDNA and RNA-binding protein